MRFSASILGWPLLCTQLVSAHNILQDRDADVVTVHVPAPTSAPSTSYTTPQVLIESALNSTNQFRAQHNAAALTWNTSLADAASSWASNCQWEHSGGPTGENLAIGYPDMTSAIDAWGNERTIYDFNTPTGFGKETGHFTQLVWKATTSVGCAAVDCTDRNSLQGYMVVCEYYPPGNMVGEDNKYFRENVQAQVQVEAPPSPPPIPQAPTMTLSRSVVTLTTTATVFQVVTSANFMAPRPQIRSSAWALGEEAAADQLQAKSIGRWVLGVGFAAMAVAGAIG